MQFVIVPIAELKKRIRGGGRKWNLYLTVCGEGKKTKCFDTRDLKDEEEVDLFEGGPVRSERDYTTFLNKWTLLD